MRFNARHKNYNTADLIIELSKIRIEEKILMYGVNVTIYNLIDNY